ncbi:hypothetical protein ACFL59_10510, partial [Planctomycetota bacterium]
MAQTMNAGVPALDTPPEDSSAGSDTKEAGGRHACPAFLSRYRDLSALRYDFPLVLIPGDPDRFVRSLSDIVNGALEETAPKGIAGEHLRKCALRLEAEIRSCLSRGQTGSLTQLWDQAAQSLLEKAEEDRERDTLNSALRRVRSAVRVDGELIDCLEETPGKLLMHTWKAVQRKRNHEATRQLSELIIKLSGILKSDFFRSDEGRSPQVLKSGIGVADKGDFDFEVLSSILKQALPKDPIPEARRERVRRALAVLESQRFFPASAEGEGTVEPFSFVFRSCSEALETFQSRLPMMVEFLTAVRIAELEVENSYREEVHDSIFAELNEGSLTAEDIALFPSYLILLDGGQLDETQKAKLMDILSSGLPLKTVVTQTEVLTS